MHEAEENELERKVFLLRNQGRRAVPITDKPRQSLLILGEAIKLFCASTYLLQNTISLFIKIKYLEDAEGQAPCGACLTKHKGSSAPVLSARRMTEKIQHHAQGWQGQACRHLLCERIFLYILFQKAFWSVPTLLSLEWQKATWLTFLFSSLCKMYPWILKEWSTSQLWSSCQLHFKFLYGTGIAMNGFFFFSKIYLDSETNIY